jgi:hypothetical protein
MNEKILLHSLSSLGTLFHMLGKVLWNSACRRALEIGDRRSLSRRTGKIMERKTKMSTIK